MDIHHVSQGGERDDKHCAYVYPEGHEKSGQQCRGMKGASGYCPGHVKSLGLSKPEEAPRGAPVQALGKLAESLPEASGGVSGVAGMASESVARSAAAWLDAPETQAALRRRWDKVLRNGTDADAIRLWKELNDARPEAVEIEIPTTLQEIRAMSDDELVQALRQLQAEGY